MTLFQIIFVPACGLTAATLLYRTFRRPQRRRHGYFWSFLWLVAAVVIAIPSLTGALARWLGIGRGADLVFYLAILAGLAASIYFYGQLRRLEILATSLARNEALAHARRGAETAGPDSIPGIPDDDASRGTS